MKLIQVRRAGGLGAAALLAVASTAAIQGSASGAVTAAAPAGLPAAGPVVVPATAPAEVPAAVAGTARPDPAALASRIAEWLGSRTAGGYVDQRGRPVVTVTRTQDGHTVRSLGAVPKTVPRSGTVLAKAAGRLGREVRTPGTGWAIDPVTAQVVVSADSTVVGARLTALKQAVRRQGATTRLERVPGRMKLLIAGGDPIYGGGYRCSEGFNVRRGTTYYFLTAGHCTDEASRWRLRTGATLGITAGSSFPGNDYGLVRYTNSSVTKTGGVNLYNGTFRDITGAGKPVVGTTVQRSGSTTRLHSGRILGVNTVVNYEEGRVSGLIRTNVCAEGGDSGGPLFRGKVALGLTSGGSGDCTTGGETYFQPVIEVMQKYKVSLY